LGERCQAAAVAAGIIADKLIEKVEYDDLGDPADRRQVGWHANILLAAALTCWISAILLRRRRAW
jgi:hypothetical protein